MAKKKSSIKLDAPIRFACKHIFGKEYTEYHRRCMGIVAMAFGVSLSLGAHEMTFRIIHFAGDFVGYLFHGMGCIPIIQKYCTTDNES